METENDLPKDLLEVIKQGLDGYKLKVVYSLKLIHGLMGYFPALSVSENERVLVFTDDPSVLKDIWKLLPSRPSEIEKRLFYVNEKEGIGFDIVFGYRGDEIKKLPADKLITRDILNYMKQNNLHRFEWANGLFGNDWSKEHFMREINKEIEKIL